jgi:hypothetical protein
MKPEALAVLIALVLSGAACAQEDPCAGYSWNIAHERALFSAVARSAVLATTNTNAPVLGADQLIDLVLSPQSQVHFAVLPERSESADGRYAGLARLSIAQPGDYRLALDQAAWIDVIARGHAIPSTAHQGQAQCNAPRKIVLFRLPAGEELLIQLSGAPQPHLRLTVTLETREGHG